MYRETALLSPLDKAAHCNEIHLHGLGTAIPVGFSMEPSGPVP